MTPYEISYYEDYAVLTTKGFVIRTWHNYIGSNLLGLWIAVWHSLADLLVSYYYQLIDSLLLSEKLQSHNSAAVIDLSWRISGHTAQCKECNYFSQLLFGEFLEYIGKNMEEIVIILQPGGLQVYTKFCILNCC